MAFSGLHIACIVVVGPPGYREPSAVGLGSKPVWSENLASPGATTRSAAVPAGWSNPPIFQVQVSADAYVAIGSAPDATQAAGDGNSARLLIRANDTREIAVTVGDKLAWALA